MIDVSAGLSGMLGLLMTTLLTWLALFFFTVRPSVANPHWQTHTARPSVYFRRSDSTSSILTTASVDSFNVADYTLVQSRPLAEPLRPAWRQASSVAGKRVRLSEPELKRPAVPERASSNDKIKRRGTAPLSEVEEVAIRDLETLLTEPDSPVTVQPVPGALALAL